jgi:imidazolonepropionase-like amidohydrolase
MDTWWSASFAWGRTRGIELEPFGLDVSGELVALARQRFPGLEDHFYIANAWMWEPPRRFDFVYTLFRAQSIRAAGTQCVSYRGQALSRRVNSVAVAVLLVGICVAVLASQQRRPAPPVVIKAARLLDVRTGAYRSDQAILVINDRIARIGPVSQLGRELPAGTRTLDLGSATLLPGLIDAHAHLLASMDGGIDVRPNLLAAINAGVPARVALGRTHARELLNAGFTTVRNVGHSGVDGDIKLRDEISSGATAGPRILAAGRKITPPGGQAFGNPPVDAATVRKEYLPVATPAEAILATRELLGQHVDVVKIVADDDIRLLSSEAISAIVRTAHAAGVRVAAHATTAAGIQAALDGGVDSVEHGTEATDAMLTTMRDSNIALDPTPFTAEAFRAIFITDRTMTDAARSGAEQQITSYMALVDGLIKRAARLNVTIVAGSDMWWTYPGKTRGQATATMLHALAHAGLSPAAVIRASTIDSATVLGWADRVGSLEPNHYADIIAVRGDPLRDIGALDAVVFVMKGGTVVVGPK